MASIKEREVVPDELMALVDNLRKYVKGQKMIREENCCQRFSIEPIVQVENEMDDNVRSALPKVEIEIQRCVKIVDSLKKEARELLHDAEMAYRLTKSGIGIRSIYSSPEHFEYSIPSVDNYFQSKIDKFEEKIKVYLDEIKDLQTLLSSFSKPHNPDELFAIIKRQHEILVGLSSQVYSVQDTLAKANRSILIS